MSGPKVPLEALQELAASIEAALEAGHPPPGVSSKKGTFGAIQVAAHKLGLNESTARARVRMCNGQNLIDWGKFVKPEPVPVVAAPWEPRDAAFWKRRAEHLNEVLGSTERTLREVSGLMERKPEPPKWSLPSIGKEKRRAAGLLTISDIHGGEVVKEEEVNGTNIFDLDICQDRLRRLFSATIQIIPRWAADCKLMGIFVALNGDLVSGDIHEELRQTNALTAQKQVWFVGDELTAGIAKLADKFGSVYVCVTPGNHGRSTIKTHAKRTSDLSYDTMIGDMIRRHFVKDARVTVQVSPSRDATYDILGKHVLQTHNDQGGGGGQGFAGPMLPIVRKGKSVEWMAAQSRVFYDIILTAHYHTSGNLGKILANGSVVGYSEFARSIRASPEPAQQWLALVHERWGIRERCEIKLQ